MIKTTKHLLMIFVIFLAACSQQGLIKPAPTAALVRTPTPSTTLDVTQTPLPTPDPITVPISEITLDHCVRIVDAHISDSGVLHILYATDIHAVALFSKFGYSDIHTGLTRWSDDTQQTVPYVLPENAQGPLLAPNGTWVVFRRDTGENFSEIRITDVMGQNERTLAILDHSEIEKHYPSRASLISYTYEWIPNTDSLVFSVTVILEDSELAPLTYDQVAVVDAITGNTFFLEGPAGIRFYKFSPNGRQMAIRTEQELRVIDTHSGKMLFKHPSVPTDDFIFSPNGSYILEFIKAGIQRTDTNTGEQQLIPLDYTVMHTRTEGPALSPLPDLVWTDDTHILLASLNSDEQFLFAVNKANPKWTFTVFQVDIANGRVETLDTFDGSPLGSVFSPDHQHLAFWKYEGNLPDQRRDLYIADIVSGETVEVIETGEFMGWFPDSERYLYATGLAYPVPGKGDPGSPEADIKYFLGQIDKEAVQINWNSPALRSLRFADWLDANRLLGECAIYKFE